MRVIEQYICGKQKSPELCEDGLFIGERLAAVIDGVSSTAARNWHGKKSGRYAMEILQEALLRLDRERVAMERTAASGVLDAAEQCLKALDLALGDAVLKIVSESGSRPALEEYPRASVILYDDVSREVWCYGDCHCIVGGVLHDHAKEIDRINARMRASVLEYALLNGASMDTLQDNDPGRIYIRENIQRQHIFENRKGRFGYPVLNGMGIEPSMIVRYTVEAGTEVVLASDGYPFLKPTLAESEAELQALLREDPMCFRRYESTKGVQSGNVSFDDRCYCRLGV